MKSYEVEAVKFRRYAFKSKLAQTGTGPRNTCSEAAGGSDRR
jgi:hypothetical protein